MAYLFLWPHGTAHAMGAVPLPLIESITLGSIKTVLGLPANTSLLLTEAQQNAGVDDFMLSVIGDDGSHYAYSFSAAIPLPSGYEPPDISLTYIQSCGVPSTEGTSAVSPWILCSSPPGAEPCYVERAEGATSYTTVGEMHLPPGSTGTFTYQQTASSDIEIGYSVDGQNWKAGGSYKVVKQDSASTTWDRSEGFARQVQTDFGYGKYKTYGPNCGSQQTIRAEDWRGGNPDGVDVSQWDGRCFSDYTSYKEQYANGSLTRDKLRGFHYQIGVTVFGVNLGAETDYTTATSLTMRFSSAQWICGNDAPPTASTLIYKQ